MIARVRTKICGITSVHDALLAVDAGADAIGLVFYEPSPRFVSVPVAQDICRSLPPFVSVVGLFVNHGRAAVREICAKVPLSLLQFHGAESERDCLGFDMPYIKAIQVRDETSVAKAESEFSSALGLLVDTYKAGVAGGTGESFDWSLLPPNCSKPLVLAGGLNPQNVRNAIVQVNPYAVDVSGGVEQEKGIKDRDKLISFIKEVSSEC